MIMGSPATAAVVVVSVMKTLLLRVEGESREVGRGAGHDRRNMQLQGKGKRATRGGIQCKRVLQLVLTLVIQLLASWPLLNQGQGRLLFKVGSKVLYCTDIATGCGARISLSTSNLRGILPE